MCELKIRIIVVLRLITNYNKARFITPGMADGQQSSIFQDVETLLESNRLWDGVGLEQQANRFPTSLCSQPINPVTYSKCSKGFSQKIKCKANGQLLKSKYAI